MRSGNGLIEVTYTLNPVQETSDLQATLTGFGLPLGLTTALDSKLEATLVRLGTDNTAAACGSLQAFVNEVKAQEGKKLTSAQAQQLTDAATDIRAQLGC